MNFSFPSLYKEIEKRYINDKEYREALYILTDNVYREEILTLFNKEKYDESISDMIKTLYDEIKTNENISAILEIVKQNYDEEMAFTILFSYDYFHLFLPILKNTMEELPVDIQPLLNVFL